MKKLRCHIALVLFSLLSLLAKGQENNELQDKSHSNGLGIMQQSDSLVRQFNDISQNVVLARDTALQNKISQLKQSLQHRIDSLKGKGGSSPILQQKFDSLNVDNIISEDNFQKLLSLDQKVKGQFENKVSKLDTLSSIGNIVKEKIGDVQSASTDLRIGPLGKDLNPTLNSPLSETNIPALPSVTNPEIEIPGVSKPDAINTDLPAQKIPGDGLNLPSTQLRGEVSGLQNQTGKINDVVNQAGNIAQDAGEYTKEIKTIKEEGLTKTEKLPELAEQQASQIEEVKALQAQDAASTKQLEEYKKLIEQYKEEKKIREELKEKMKELATEKITQNQGKVNEVMKKVDKYKRKFSQVHDMRNLPKRAPNPLKDLSWRERVVPGFTLQTLSGDATWLEFDPQVYYKLNGNLSAGIGGMYRFSMDPDKLTFDDFGSMWGAKIFVQYHVMKGFFVRGEGQHVRWKPWDLKLTDPNYIDHTFVAAAGIGKSYQIAKKLKGNIQTLYHFHWGGMDPYKPKVMIRIGFDFSLKKREEKHWEKKLKERKQESRK